MRYINLRLTYLLTYISNVLQPAGPARIFLLNYSFTHALYCGLYTILDLALNVLSKLAANKYRQYNVRRIWC